MSSPTRILVLSPHFPALFLPFWEQLWRAGVQVMGIADIPWEELPPVLQKHLHAYWRVDSMHSLEELEKACYELCQRHGEIHYLESLNEYWLETEAQLRSRLNILGPNSESIHRLKHKSEMQSIYAKAGIPIPPGLLLYGYEQGKQWLKEVGFPVVAKPDVGVGAAQTYKLDSMAAYEDFWHHKPNCAYFLQSFITGELYSFDGLVDHTGKLCFMASHHFTQGIMDVVNQDLDLRYYSLRTIPESLKVLGEKTIAAFELHSRFFHFEFFRQGPDEWVALEVNIRPPGGWTLDMFNLANNMSIFEHYTDIILQRPPPQQAPIPFHVGYAGRKSKNYRHSPQSIQERLGDRLWKESPIENVFQAVMGQHGYLVRHESLNQVQADLQYIQELV